MVFFPSRDWEKRFQTLGEQDPVSVRVEAARGFQGSGLKVLTGRRYDYETIGSWGTSADGLSTDADGGSGGTGRMVGVVMTDYRLGEPFDLGRKGTFVAATSGNLYVRCRAAWNQLQDNHGAIHVRFTAPAKNGT